MLNLLLKVNETKRISYNQIYNNGYYEQKADKGETSAKLSVPDIVAVTVVDKYTLDVKGTKPGATVLMITNEVDGKKLSDQVTLNVEAKEEITGIAAKEVPLQ
jgi:hypothetical protein